MNRFGKIRAALLAAGVLGLAACDLTPGIDPVVAQQLVAAKANPDRALADKVKRALETEASAGAQGIEVTATNGTVQLWGLVDSTRGRKRAEQIAAGVVGVRAVDSRLEVDAGA